MRTTFIKKKVIDKKIYTQQELADRFEKLYNVCLENGFIPVVESLALCSGINSMNEINKSFNTDQTLSNINNILNEHYIELPHKDTLINVISEIKFEELEHIQTKIIKTLIRSKMLDKYRFNGL